MKKLLIPDNYFLLRFKILYEYYNILITMNPQQQTYEKLVRDISKQAGVVEQVVKMNIAYLMVQGYLEKTNIAGLESLITLKGIKLVEDITDGNMFYQIPENTDDDESELSRAWDIVMKFRKNDVIVAKEKLSTDYLKSS